MDTQGMKTLHKVIKRVLRYEIGVFLKNSGFSMGLFHTFLGMKKIAVFS